MENFFLHILDKAWIAITVLAGLLWKGQVDKLKRVEEQQEKNSEIIRKVELELAALSLMPNTIKDIKNALVRIESKLDGKQDKA